MEATLSSTPLSTQLWDASAAVLPVRQEIGRGGIRQNPAVIAQPSSHVELVDESCFHILKFVEGK
ncbi:unnamed protein product [Urochloa humidicola]